MRGHIIWLAALCAIGAASPARAEEASSAYTKVDVRKDCKHEPGRAEEDYGGWLCKGYAAAPMWLGAGDQRMFVSFGRRAKDEPAASETLAPFNDFYEGVVEWRLAAGMPFAAIMRWNYKTQADRENRKATGRALVVTRLPPGPVCHVGYVDARANANANALARQIADGHARGFVCGKDKPVILGAVGRGAEFR